MSSERYKQYMVASGVLKPLSPQGKKMLEYLAERVREHSGTQQQPTAQPQITKTPVEVKLDSASFIDADKIREALDANTARIRNTLVDLIQGYEIQTEKTRNRHNKQLEEQQETLETLKTRIFEQLNQRNSFEQQIVDELAKLRARMDKKEAEDQEARTLEKLALEKLYAVLGKYG